MTADFQCCFCGRTIIAEGVDPGHLAYTPHRVANALEIITQDLYWHIHCLANSIHNTVQLYAIDLVEPAEN
jgi:hypothetical protein